MPSISRPASLPVMPVMNDTPQLFWPKHHVDVLHAELTERIDHGRDNARRRAERAGFAHAFRAQRVQGRRRHGGGELEAREIDGARKCVIHERAGQQLTVFVVDHFFYHGLPDALGEAAVNLSFDDERVDEMSRIVHRHELQECWLPCLTVDLDHRDVTTERVRVVTRLEEGFITQAGLEAGRERYWSVGICGHARERLP